MIGIDNIGKVLENRFPVSHAKSSAEFPEKKAKASFAKMLSRHAGEFHGWISLLMKVMGMLMIVFGCVFAVMARFNAMVALGVALLATVTGASFIGVSKIVEAAELYIMKNNPDTPEAKTRDTPIY